MKKYLTKKGKWFPIGRVAYTQLLKNISQRGSLGWHWEEYPIEYSCFVNELVAGSAVIKELFL